MQENAENEGKTTSRAEKCHGGSRKILGQKRTFKESLPSVRNDIENWKKRMVFGFCRGIMKAMRQWGDTTLSCRCRTRNPNPHGTLRFQKTCPGGSLRSPLFRRRPCGRDPKRPATKGGKGTESRDQLETRRLPPLKARGSRESSHGRRRKRGDQLDRFFENADSCGE